jgi:beta-lactamase superfamily II metal-dependent hydrolase
VRAPARALLALAAFGLVPLSATPAAAQPTLAAPVGKPSPGTYVVHVIDVGTGLAVFVEGEDFALLYDAGSKDDTARGGSNRVVAYLHHVRPDLRRIDHLVLSHPHQDHSELMPDVLASFAVGNLWDSGALNPICSYRLLLKGAASTPSVAYHDSLAGSGSHSAAFGVKPCYGRSLGAETLHIPRGTQITAHLAVPLGRNASMTFLHADGNVTEFNDASVVVRLNLGSRHILLPGDAQGGARRAPTDPLAPRSVEKQVLDCCRADLAADVLVAGHHGSMTSSRTAFLDAVGAKVYVVSAGPTKYQTVILPDQNVLDELNGRGTVWRTDATDKRILALTAAPGTPCESNLAKIGPDNDNRAGGCDNVIVFVASDGSLTSGYYHGHD